MAWSVSAEVAAFDEAVEWFMDRVPTTQAELDTLDDASRRRAFTIAGALEIEAVQVIFDELATSLEQGTPFEDFRKQVTKKLDGKVGAKSAHLETVFVNANQTAYNTGRWEQLTSPDAVLFRPFLMFDAVLDDRTSEICKLCDGVIKSHFDPWWLTHTPIMHHRCRSTLRSLRRSQAEEMGITEGDPAGLPPGGFGKAPPLRDDSVLRPKPDDFDQDVWAIFESREFQAALELDDELQDLARERFRRDADND